MAVVSDGEMDVDVDKEQQQAGAQLQLAEDMGTAEDVA